MKILCFVAIIVSPLSCLYAEEINIGIGYPYISLSYDTSIHRRYEIRTAFGCEINVIGIRAYHFLERGWLSPFLGAEADYLWFSEPKGEGVTGSLFLGGEIGILRRVSLITDFSLSYILLKSKGYTQEGIEPVVNMGINVRIR